MSDYRREIDGLRAIAVIPVILFHAGFDLFSGGFVGVDVFFVISGYLITSIILREKQAGTFTLTGFYERRARRILPALLLVIICCLPFAAAWSLPAQLKSIGESIIAVLMFVSNIFFWRESGYFNTAAGQMPFLHTWSLAVEEQFYIVFPVVLAVLLLFPRRRLYVLLGLAAVGSIGLAEWGWRYHSIANFYLFPTRAWELLIGTFCAFYLHRRDRNPSSGFLSLLGLALILFSVLTFNRMTPFPSLYALIPTLGTALIILFCRPSSLSYGVLASPPLVGLGLISYSAYLWHLPLLIFARTKQSQLDLGLILSLCLAAFVLAYFSWRFVETPFRQKQLISSKRLGLALGPTYAALALAAIWIVQSDGFISRYTPMDQKLVSVSLQEFGKYVNGRFSRLQLAKFEDDRKIRLLVIGDSYGQDLVNALYESNLTEHFQISTHHISTRCGNLMLEVDFTDRILSKNHAKCARDGWYEGPEVQNLMAQADVIWLASSWSPWQAELLPKSVQAIQASFNAQVLVLGNKNLGAVDLRDLLGLSVDGRRNRRNQINDASISLIEYMSSTLPDNVFIDAQGLLCDQRQSCPVFTPDLDLISYDGGHLSKSGAKLLGQALTAHPLIQQVIADKQAAGR